MSKKMTFYTAGRPYTLGSVEDGTAESLAKAVKRSWESGKPLTFDCQVDGIKFFMRSDCIEAIAVEEVV